jgi:hypothetical protein
MRSAYLYWPEGQKSGYAKVLLRRLCQQAGIEIASTPEAAESVWVSMCDITDVRHLLAARELGRPLVAGGWVSFLPALRRLADYVCVGEAYDFVKQYARAPRLSALGDLDYVSTPEKQGLIDERINWRSNPLVKIGGRAYYYYCGKGCPMRCKYCAMSYSRHVQFAPHRYIDGACASMPKNGKLVLMVSYLGYDLSAGVHARLGATDVKVTQYIRENPQKMRMVRTGLEFFSEDVRRNIAKPISHDQLCQFLAMTKENNAEVTLYVIAGVESNADALAFAESLPVDMDVRPRVHLRFTYYDPQPLTPGADWDVRQKQQTDFLRLMAMCHQRNRRIRINPVKAMGHSTWRTMMQRAATPEAVAWAIARRTREDHEGLCLEAERDHPELLGGMSTQQLIEAPRRMVESAFRPDIRDAAMVR